jgi:hypothetical protein
LASGRRLNESRRASGRNNSRWFGTNPNDEGGNYRGGGQLGNPHSRTSGGLRISDALKSFGARHF